MTDSRIARSGQEPSPEPHALSLRDRGEVTEDRKPRGFRFGLTRKIGDEYAYKVAARVDLASDGGVAITPYLNDRTWTYGPLAGDRLLEDQWETTDLRPKLHYHRSGIVSATPPTGQDMPRRRLHMRPLTTLRDAQILSVAVIRTWELPTHPKGQRSGDESTPVYRWPDLAFWTISVVKATAHERRPLLTDTPSRGLLTGETFTHGVISLAAYGHQALLIITVETIDDYKYLPNVGGTTLAAIPRRAKGERQPDRTFGLWTTGLRNPFIKWDKALPATLKLASTSSVKPQAVAYKQLADTTVPRGGFTWRRKRPATFVEAFCKPTIPDTRRATSWVAAKTRTLAETALPLTTPPATAHFGWCRRSISLCGHSVPDA